MSEPTYVYGEVEVKKTGRRASKPIAGGKVSVVEEITPINDYDGTWKKWVIPTALYQIEESSK